MKFPPTNEDRANSNGLHSPNLSNLHRGSATFVDWEGEFWLLNLHSHRSLDVPAHLIPLLHYPSRGSFTACCSHHNNLSMDSSEHKLQQAHASSPPHLTFYQVRKFLGTKTPRILLLSWSFAYAQRKTSTTICSSGERIPLCLLFPDPATNVLRIFWKPLLGNCNHSKAQVYRFCLFSPENSIIMRQNVNGRFQPPKSYLLYWADSSWARGRAALVIYLLDTAEGRYLL